MRELMLGAVPEPAILVLRGGEVLANGADCTAVEAAAAGHGPWPAGDLEAAIAMSIAENKAIVRRWSEELWS